MGRRLRRFGGLLLLLALGAASYAATERVYDPDAPVARAPAPAVRPGEIRAADGQATRGRDAEEVAPVALVGGLLLVGGLFLLTLTLPTAAERRRAAAHPEGPRRNEPRGP